MRTVSSALSSDFPSTLPRRGCGNPFHGWTRDRLLPLAREGFGMPSSRSVWSGYVRFSLVSMPVKAYTAAVSGGGGAPALNQLHRDCNSRIQYKKNCPVHGEVSNDQIVS